MEGEDSNIECSNYKFSVRTYEEFILMYNIIMMIFLYHNFQYILLVNLHC